MRAADFHASLILQTRLPGGEMEEDLREAARAAAAAASETLARSDFGGRSASVDFSVSFDVRTVPQSTPAGRFVEVFDLDQPEPVFEDTPETPDNTFEDTPETPDTEAD